MSQKEAATAKILTYLKGQLVAMEEMSVRIPSCIAILEVAYDGRPQHLCTLYSKLVFATGGWAQLQD